MNLLSIINKFLFWQPQKDFFKKTTQYKYGNQLLIVINYTIWVFLFFVSYFLIKKDINIFWQLFFATLIGEIVEKILKIKSFWKRPLHINNNTLPDGFLKSWYRKGSFPSGHTIKAVFFFILLLQTQIIILPFWFLMVAIPLVSVRVFLGLHYPIDVLGGIIIGFIIGAIFTQIQFPLFLNNFIKPIFNFIFFIN